MVCDVLFIVLSIQESKAEVCPCSSHRKHREAADPNGHEAWTRDFWVPFGLKRAHWLLINGEVLALWYLNFANVGKSFTIMLIHELQFPSKTILLCMSSFEEHICFPLFNQFFHEKCCLNICKHKPTLQIKNKEVMVCKDVKNPLYPLTVYQKLSQHLSFY